jgi:1-deoxy-D-xylulose-5-phosphate reductoisomerase
VLNAANEVAVAAFLDRRLAFTDIARVNADVMAALPAAPLHALGDALEADRAARVLAAQAVRTLGTMQ